MCSVPPPVAEERRAVQEGAFGCEPFLTGQRPTVVVLERRARRQFQDAQFGLVPSLSQMDLYLLRGNGGAKSVNGSASLSRPTAVTPCLQRGRLPGSGIRPRGQSSSALSANTHRAAQLQFGSRRRG